MKSRNKVRLVSAISFAVLSVLVFQDKAPSASRCDVSVAVEASPLLPQTCQPQQSWFNWLQGNSRSTQFHFFDLLELLGRFKQPQS